MLKISAGPLPLLLWLFLMIATPSQPVLAMEGILDKGNYFGLGMMSHNAGAAASTATSESKPLFQQLYPQLSLSHFFPVSGGSIAPHFNFSLTAKDSPDGKVKTSTSSVGLRYHYPASNQWDLHIGSGILAYQMKGLGGSVTLSNGSSTTDFAGADSTRSSSLFFMDLGSGVQFNKHRFELSIFITKFLDNQKRGWSPLLIYSYEVF